MGRFWSPYFVRDSIDSYEEQDHEEFTERLKKSLYYGQLPSTDRPSKHLTDIAVEFYQDASQRQLDRLNTDLASAQSRQACMSPTSIVNGMIYVNRLKKRNSNYLQKISSSDLFFISVMMASKFLYDEGIDDEVFNDEWAASADKETDDVNELEREFLSAMEWQLYIKPEDFQRTLSSVERKIALEQGTERGWFTYTDLAILSQEMDCQQMVLSLYKDLSKMMLVSSVAYLAGLMTVMVSTAMMPTVSMAIGASAPMFVYQPLRQPLPLPAACNNTRANRLESGQKTDKPGAKLMEEPGVESDQLDAKKTTSYGISSFFSTVLSQLLAVCTLKSSVLNLPSSSSCVRSRSSRNSADRNCHLERRDFGLDSDVEEVCALGPCQFPSRNCQNISVDFDGKQEIWGEAWTLFRDSFLDNTHQPKNCHVLNGECGRREVKGTAAKCSSFVKCCCLTPIPTIPPYEELVKDRYSDVSLGFATGVQFSPFLAVS